jgi:hypothetical protein
VWDVKGDVVDGIFRSNVSEEVGAGAGVVCGKKGKLALRFSLHLFGATQCNP